MKTQISKFALGGLQWSLGLVILLESCMLAFSPARRAAFGHTGFPNWLRLALAVPEIVAAILFLIPGTVILGGYSLIVIFGLAAMVHLLHGQLDVSGLVVYAMAVAVILSEERGKKDGGGPPAS